MQEKYTYMNIQEYDVINYEVTHINENKNNFMSQKMYAVCFQQIDRYLIHANLFYAAIRIENELKNKRAIANWHS